MNLYHFACILVILVVLTIIMMVTSTRQNIGSTVLKSGVSKEEIRIMRIVATVDFNHRLKADRVMATWGQRCTKLIFMSNAPDHKLPILYYNVSSGKNTLTYRHFKAFKDASRMYLNDYEWFLKADDDTFVIMENLRDFLSSKNKSDAIYFGHPFKHINRPYYATGGAGYVVSQEAMGRFRDSDSPLCNANSTVKSRYADDTSFAICMIHLNVTLGTHLDSSGGTLFHQYDLNKLLHNKYPVGYIKNKSNLPKTGAEGMSEYPISLHHVKPEEMEILDHLIYKIKVHGEK